MIGFERVGAPAMRVALAGVVAACGGRGGAVAATVAPEPATVSERMLAMLPQGAQVVVELDLARLRANAVVGEVVTRALAERPKAMPEAMPEATPEAMTEAMPDAMSDGLAAGMPASPLAAADQVVLAAYGVGTAQAATLTVLAAPHDLPDTTKLADGFYAVGPTEWIEQAQQRIALAGTGDGRFAIAAAPELLELRARAMPASAPGASLRVTARLSFDARVALARQTGLDAAPAQLSAWGDVADDLALVVDCDAEDPGSPSRGRASDAPKRLEAALRGALAALADQPAVRSLGLPSSLAGARFVARGSWVRTIIAVGPAHLRRVVARATAMLATPPAAAPRGDSP
jgi:hypothetical protein